EYMAAKVYRPRMFRSLKNDAIYRESRVSLDERGHAIRSKRGRRAASKESERGRALQVTSWIQYEYQVQQELYLAGADVPQTFAQSGNAILMAYLGNGDMAAPRLSDVELEPEEAGPLFERLIDNIGLFLGHHRIHGDLSPYNI